MEYDFRLLDSGSIWQLVPLKPHAQAWCDEHLPEDCPMMGSSYCIEARYIGPIVHGIMEAGMNFTRSAW